MNVRSKLLWLNEAIEKYYPNWKVMLEEYNLLIVSPCGSGKTTFINSSLFIDEDKKYLYISDTSNLKIARMNESDCVDTKNRKMKDYVLTKNFFGKPNETVMTYFEFGKIMKELSKNKNPNQITEKQIEYIEQFDIIVCDEMHDLFIYNSFSKTDEYLHAIDKLIVKYEKTKLVFLTATPNAFYKFKERMRENYDWTFDFFKELIFTDKEKIQRYANDRVDYLSSYKRIPRELNCYKDKFKIKGEKVLIYTKKIENMKAIEELVKKENDFINCISIWSENNTVNKMNEEQLRVRDYIIKEGNFPIGYNCVIINDATQTGVNIYDPFVTIMMCNTSDKDSIEQSRGRIRHDIDLLIIRDIEKAKKEKEIKINNKWLNIQLTKKDKDLLVKELDIYDENGRLVKWNTIKNKLKTNGYSIEDKKITIEGKRKNISIINKIANNN